MKMTITINEREYVLKYTIRAMFIFEQITKKQFEMKTLLDTFVFFYSMILANNDDCLTWDEFIEAIDTDPTLYEQFQSVLNKQNAIEEVFPADDVDSKKA